MSDFKESHSRQTANEFEPGRRLKVSADSHALPFSFLHFESLGSHGPMTGPKVRIHVSDHCLRLGSNGHGVQSCE